MTVGTVVALLGGSAIALAPSALAASGGGCTKTSIPQGSISACVNATNLGYTVNPDGYISNLKGCTDVWVILQDNSYANTSTREVGCASHVVGYSVSGYGRTQRTVLEVYYGSTLEMSYSPWQYN